MRACCDGKKAQLSPDRAHYSRRSLSGQVLRGDELGKMDFRQITEDGWAAQLQNDRIVLQGKRFNDQGCVTGAGGTAVAAVVVLMILQRCTGLPMAGSVRDPGSTRLAIDLGGMGTVVSKTEADRQQRQEQEPRDKFEG